MTQQDAGRQEPFRRLREAAERAPDEVLGPHDVGERVAHLGALDARAEAAET